MPATPPHPLYLLPFTLALVMCYRCDFLTSVTGMRVRKYGTHDLYRDEPCMYLVSFLCHLLSLPARATGPDHHGQVAWGCVVCHAVMGCSLWFVLQSNHRSWADFFIDAYLTEGRGQLMSRWVQQPWIISGHLCEHSFQGSGSGISAWLVLASHECRCCACSWCTTAAWPNFQHVV